MEIFIVIEEIAAMIITVAEELGLAQGFIDDALEHGFKIAGMTGRDISDHADAEELKFAIKDDGVEIRIYRR